ncbi:TetR/AcrR family transcriptional regulator [Dyadobacter sediminis]|uniref:TetR/AcrR family transcriptional regulator n=1 Tax=Dyadobacter sediminis TaxID=1493691 RepID=A0A5R9KE84_9BACT|nr:TetR/AcrR family transcriptional regulator [Dyadobacter sediminis]TLU94429.1 TetR/AcrR family transcriptional regulator [Dyadobacter sediminis]GGB91315.1 transcriptional regulator [Dyadobacter sediminis]
MNKAEKTRQFIIEKTAPIFNVKGFAGTSINDMIQATGLTKGSIYGNFRNKDDVALAAFDHNLKMVHKVIRHEMDSKDSVKERLLVYVHVYNNFLEFPFPDGGCPILNTSTEADDTHPELRQKAADAIMQWKNNLQALIKKGMDNREFHADTDPEQMALTIIAMIEGGIMMAKVTGKLNYRNAVMKSIKKMIDDLG